MMPQGHPSLLRSKSGMLGGQGGGTPSQNAFVSQHDSLSNFNVPNLNSSGLVQGHQQFCRPMLTADQLDTHKFHHNQQQQFNVASNSQQQQLHAHQFQAMRHGAGRVNVEQQTANEQSLQQLQALRNIGSSVKMEPQQIQSMRSLDSSLFFPQQQQFLMSRHSCQAQISHQQRLVQIQQQQLLKSTPQQRSQLQSQFQHQNFPIRSPVKPVYEPGMCARRLTHYMYQKQHKPEDNNIEFWRKFVAEFFAPNAKKKLCVSMYGSGRQNTGVSPQDVWHCEICNRKPGRGFEATVEVLPRLFKIKYESGTLDELLYVDMPREYQNSSGQIVLDYAKAIQESIFEQLRVVRDGQLRIVFSPDLKICSWEFCARCHEELIPRRLLIPQVSQVGTAAQKCQAATQNTSPSSSVSELQNNCNMFVASAHQLAKAVEVPLVNDLGLSKRYVRCLQISEVVNSMKNLIDYSSETGAGPMESLAKFPRRTNTSSSSQQPESRHHNQRQQQIKTMGQNSKNDDDNDINSAQSASMQLGSTRANNRTPINTSTANLLHHNSMRNTPMSNPNTSDVSNIAVQTLSPVENNTLSPRASLSNNNNNNNLQPIYPVNMANSPNIGDMDAQSSVQKIMHDMLMSSQLGSGEGTVSDVKNVNGSIDGDNDILVGTGVAKGSVSGFDSIQNGLDQSPMLNGIGNNYSMSMNGPTMDMNSQHNDQLSWSGQWF